MLMEGGIRAWELHTSGGQPTANKTEGAMTKALGYFQLGALGYFQLGALGYFQLGIG